MAENNPQDQPTDDQLKKVNDADDDLIEEEIIKAADTSAYITGKNRNDKV